MVVSQNQKMKYDNKRVIKQITDVDEYNLIGNTDGGKKDTLTHEYVTRKKEAQKANSSNKVKINKKDLVKKKKIVIPDTEKDKLYLEIIASKRLLFEGIQAKRGYIRLFETHNLPNPWVYEATVHDMAFLKTLNKKSSQSLTLKVEEFEKMIEILEKVTAGDDEVGILKAVQEVKNNVLTSKASQNDGNIQQVYQVSFLTFFCFFWIFDFFVFLGF